MVKLDMIKSLSLLMPIGEFEINYNYNINNYGFDWIRTFYSEFQFPTALTTLLRNKTTPETTTTPTTTEQQLYSFHERNHYTMNRTKEEEEEYQRNFLILKVSEARLEIEVDSLNSNHKILS